MSLEILRKDSFELEVFRHFQTNGNARLHLVYIAAPAVARLGLLLGQAITLRLVQSITGRLNDYFSGCLALGYFGSGHFGILLTDPSEAPTILNREIAACLDLPFEVDGSKYPIRAAFGIASSSSIIHSASTLKRAAELALLEALDPINRSHTWINDRNYLLLNSRTELREDLVHAIPRSELEVAYQPIYSLRDRSIVGAEALMRWRHPRLGILQAGEFMDIAEDSGLIVDIGHWVFNEALRNAQIWSKANAGDFRLAVNVSCHELLNPGIAELVSDSLSHANFSADQLELDINPWDSTPNSVYGPSNLRALKDLGVGIALDEFGMQGNAFSTLLEMAPQRVKFPRWLTSRVPGDARAEVLCKGLIEMLLGLMIPVTGKGIETPEQQEFLFEAGCNEGQGYLFSAAIDAATMSARLAEQQIERLDLTKN